MKILYALQNITHPTIRGELRHYHLLQRLAREHEITLVALRGNEVPDAVLGELRQWTRRFFQVGTPPPRRPDRHGVPGTIARVRWRVQKMRLFQRGVAEMKECVERLMQRDRFDLLFLAGADLHPVTKGLTEVPFVVDWCDTSSIRLRHELRHTGGIEWPWRLVKYLQTRRTEKRLFAQLRHVTFVSRRDLDAATGASGTIIPNGCDLAYWSRRNTARGRSIVFTGVLDYPPNADAARYLLSSIAPLVRREVPDLEVVIAGRNPSADMLDLARRSGGVVVTGSVPDLRPYLENAAVFVAPLRFASGTQNKILEAMAMELPVVTTPVAADGIRIAGHDDPPLLVGEAPGELATHVAALLRDPAEGERLGVEGRRYVHRHCDWEQSARMLDRLCRDAASQRQSEPVAEVPSRVDRSIPSRTKDRVFHSLV